ncbi:hypothetical protein TNIN_449141 [Trichonephila inaurata madagascariensis]|uniref:Uncharacterized protein n=1 Tax=Trichonephila inaurata madagascariensis TaxID=2747483 RepID=A0A8X6XRQ2_9ARAC|nr:hypothetical protein TNIN_449141 [Trichonephila inaurata madagascariensis]
MTHCRRHCRILSERSLLFHTTGRGVAEERSVNGQREERRRCVRETELRRRKRGNTRHPTPRKERQRELRDKSEFCNILMLKGKCKNIKYCEKEF